MASHQPGIGPPWSASATALATAGSGLPWSALAMASAEDLYRHCGPFQDRPAWTWTAMVGNGIGIERTINLLRLDFVSQSVGDE